MYRSSKLNLMFILVKGIHQDSNPRLLRLREQCVSGKAKRPFFHILHYYSKECR